MRRACGRGFRKSLRCSSRWRTAAPDRQCEIGVVVGSGRWQAKGSRRTAATSASAKEALPAMRGCRPRLDESSLQTGYCRSSLDTERPVLPRPDIGTHGRRLSAAPQSLTFIASRLLRPINDCSRRKRTGTPDPKAKFARRSLPPQSRRSLAGRLFRHRLTITPPYAGPICDPRSPASPSRRIGSLPAPEQRA